MVEEMVVEKGRVGGWCWPAKKGAWAVSLAVLLAEKGGRKGDNERERKGEWVYIKVKFKIITSCHSHN